MKVLARSIIYEATQWQQLGDHPDVAGATADDFSTMFGYVPNPEKLVAGVLDTGLHKSLVLPGDWVITMGGRTFVLSDEQFNRIFILFPKCSGCELDKGCCDET